MYAFTDNISFLWDTAIILELGWKRSRSNAQIQLLLLKIYGELGEEFFVKQNHCTVYDKTFVGKILFQFSVFQPPARVLHHMFLFCSHDKAQL